LGEGDAVTKQSRQFGQSSFSGNTGLAWERR